MTVSDHAAAPPDLATPPAGTVRTSPREVRVTSPAPRAVWRALLRDDPESMPGQSPAWLDCICATGTYADASRLYELPDGQQLLLPMARRIGALGIGGVEASLPVPWGIGGVLARRPPDAADIAAVATDLRARPVLRTSVRPNPRRGAVWAAADVTGAVAIPRRAHVLELADGFDHWWHHTLKSRTRGKVRKAERAGVTVECDTSGQLLPAFHDLYLRSVTRWAERQHEPTGLAHWRARRSDPLERLQRAATALGEHFQLWIARLDGDPVAGIIVLRGANAAHYTRGAMDVDRAGPAEANYLLFRHAIEDACRDGVARLHMGESGSSSSLAFFKERFGAVAHDYAEYRFERLPVTRADRAVRTLVKRVVGFEDAR